MPPFDEDERKSFMERWVAVWNTPTLSTDSLAFYTEDAVLVDKAFDRTYRGHQELYASFRATEEVLADIRVTCHDLLIGPAHAVAQLRYDATVREPFACLPESSRGKAFSLSLMCLVEFAEDGRIARGTDVYDRASVLQQLGVLPDSP
ncbi:hypothetical protein SLA_5545 [Streptomyces laurentii]|uniref:SnoaL-like domain-containing protein n=1 Tax=Streptomyces laurentii TaxID=39478 RepID=A0A169P473_STRLU|nr:hypothetical protein SLA_5545 [Streptomyces laurentii]